MKTRAFLCALLVALLARSLEAQTARRPSTKPNLAVLPVTGGRAGEGEVLANLLANQAELLRFFTVLPRTQIAQAINAEVLGFQHNANLPWNEDSITKAAEIGKRLNAQYILYGDIMNLGGRNCFACYIVNVETLQLHGGDYREYGELREIRLLLPDMAKRAAETAITDTSRKPTLSVVAPANRSRRIEDSEGEKLVRLMAIEIADSGAYAVLLRFSEDLKQVRAEHTYQRSELHSKNDPKSMTAGYNAEYVLSNEIDELGGDHLWIASILDVEEGSLIQGAQIDYRNIQDAPRGIPELSYQLTGVRSKTVFSALSDRNAVGGNAQSIRPDIQAVSAGNRTAERYSVGDIGPAGGYVFYAENGIYREVSPLFPGQYTWNQAVQAVSRYQKEGFTGWRLPSQVELRQIYENLQKTRIADFGNELYWSGTESIDGSGLVFVLRFSDGWQNYYLKARPLSVRAIRDF
jgi:hypothetical protein